ncbi:hypothetical protein CSA37_01600 [Candidatus Fermentibacteria bacterium]|nr:MAG: hypothetical protein CSA37_13530 [Candidatus Fermentibacteria bacterium]PIE53378.1 MAG: hypothetical protein CSA37_01600 [Candidatus Fermentibacteria bacterium]
MADQSILFDYAELRIDPDCRQITFDALAAGVFLENAKGDAGNLLQAVACSQGLLRYSPDYSFGAGNALIQSVINAKLRHTASCCAAMAFSRGSFLYSWFLCRQAGYGLELDPDSSEFLLELLLVIQNMGTE